MKWLMGQWAEFSSPRSLNFGAGMFFGLALRDWELGDVFGAAWNLAISLTLTVIARRREAKE